VAIERLAGRLKGETRTDAATLHAYATDASVYRIVPQGVIIAGSIEDVAITLEVCRDTGTPLTMRGAGTSLAGQAIGAGVVLDMSRLDAILSVDPDARLARVQPGVVQATLDAAVREHGLCFGPDTATATRATLGGMVGNDSAGMRSAVYGRTSHRINRLRVLLADGTDRWVGESDDASLDGPFAAARAVYHALTVEIEARWPRILRCVDGYNLPALAGDRPHLARFLCGSEGTLAIVLEIEVMLDPVPDVRAWTIVRLESLDAIGDANLAVLPSAPSAVEIVDGGAIVGSPASRDISAGADAVLLVEHSGTAEEVRAARAVMAAATIPGAAGIVSIDGPEENARIVRFRRDLQGTINRAVRGGRRPTTVVEDGAVPVERLGVYLAGLRQAFRDEGTVSVIYGHASVGCVHVRPLLDLSDAEDRARFRRLAERGADLLVANGGSLSGEHGDGILRAELLPRLFGEPLIDGFRAIKQAFDPAGILNPGRIIDAPPLDENLRTELRPRSPLELEVAGCVGIGSCLERRAGTMCPTYRVTRDERLTVRGRADLLREALSGAIPLHDPGLGEALTTCVGCKACRTECPAGVDLAWIKAQHLDARHADEGISSRDRAFAEVPVTLARLARAPRTSNLMARSPLGVLQRRRLGIHRSRRLPQLAKHTFRDLTAGRYGPRRVDVALFVDTFTQWLEPDIGLAALDYLDAAGAHPAVAPNVCCGRTYISAGMLDEARQLAVENVRRLLPLATSGVPIVGLEPSCILTLRDELVKLLPGDDDARTVSRHVLLFEEALDRWETPRLSPLESAVIVHPHCHTKALARLGATAEALGRIPAARVEVLDAGCCGMAGSFGYRAETYDLSVAMAKDRLVPAVQANPGAIVVAQGTSCRSQIADLAGRRAVHPAQLLADQLVV
jgi:FAD/FMN-containing dehydrogenase/Fe-S oxidoreductase